MAISAHSFSPLSIPTLSPTSSLSASNSSFISPASGFIGPGGTRLVLNRARPRNRFSCTCLFGLGVPELAVIAGVVALVFGPKKLPEVGRSIGKTVKSFQQAAKEFETELKKDPEPATNSPDTKPTAVSGGDEEKANEVSSNNGS